MIKILIVDDCYEKSSDIMNIIKNNTSVSIEDIEIVNDTTSARAKLEENVFDIVLLDLNVPTYIGGEPEQYGGLELINRIKTNQIKNVPSHIIATTAYDDILENLKDELESNLLGTIFYDRSTNDWHKKIINKINYVIKSKKNIYGRPFKKYDIAIVTALEYPELNAVLTLSDMVWYDLNVPGDSTTIYKESMIENTEGKKIKIIAASAPRMGMSSSAILTTKMCSHFQPEYLFMVGIAAGTKDKNRNFGDILVAQVSWDWESGKLSTDMQGNSNFIPDHTQVTLDEDIETKIKNLIYKKDLFDNIKKESYPLKMPESDLRLHIGPIASGSKVVQNGSIIDEIKSHQRKIIGLDMEIHGVMLASRYSIKSKPKAICIKSICDFGDKDKNDDWQSYAAYTSAKFMYIFIKNYLYK